MCYLRALRLLGGFGGRHRDAVATLCHNMGGIEHARGNYRAAETWARRGLRVRARADSTASFAIAADQAALAAILDGLERYDEAERLHLNALRTYEAEPRSEELEIAHVLGNLGAHYSRRRRWGEALDLLEQAVELTRRLRGGAHPEVGVALNNLAVTLRKMGRTEPALTTSAEALKIFESALGTAHPWTAACRRNGLR